ncbi:protein MMS22-like [Toxorhynchites rutilus septentrionalis]|uniref:protein MMS22-like n=1 Tax=Toxorhynchites rutilus septentrionalis TaxID=329112 RepID=UPI00247A828D|nr:protein MMS22-like [Toxorhynchites rutilus septentrionalis]
MFECKNPVIEVSCFVGDDVRQLVEVEHYVKCYSFPVAVKEDSPVQLFGIDFYYLDEELLQTLVYAARGNIGKLTVAEVRRELGDSECRRRRTEITRFLRIILDQSKNFPLCKLQEILAITQACLPPLVDIVEDFGLVPVKEMTLVSYEYFHAVLDWRWLGLLISFEIQKHEQTETKFDQSYEEMLASLVELALWKYSKTNRKELVTERQFYCPCIKQMWIGIMAISSYRNISSFWTDLQNTLERIQKGNRDASSKQKKRFGAVSIQANDIIFQTWLINGLASLYQYRLLDEVTFKEKPVIATPEDYTVLEKAIKELIQRDQSEEQTRIVLLLIKPIYTQWWQIKHELIVSLWDYFGKRLNSPFHVPSESLSNLACISRSPTDFIEKARYQASQEAFDSLSLQTSSFKCYIILLAFTLRHYSKNAQKTKVQILFNRTIFRITPPKLEQMTEQAIYNFSLLMMTMMEATTYQDDYPRLAKQLFQIKYDCSNQTVTVSSAIQRITTIVLANMALIIVFKEKGFDKSSHLRIFLQNVNEALRVYGERLQPALNVLAEGMRLVYDQAVAKGSLDEGDETFLGDWLEPYLKVCSASERDALLECLCRVVESIDRKKNLNEKAHVRILRPMYTHVLPYIKDAFAKDTATTLLIAELAVRFTLYSTGQSYAPNFLTLFNFFVDNTNANVQLRLHFVKLIVASDRIGEIEEKLLLRIWLKFSLLVGRDSEMRDFSQFVCRMGEFRSLCEVPEYDLCDGDEEPIGLFFKFVGKKCKEYEAIDIRAQQEMAIRIHALFQHFDRWVTTPNVAMLKKIMAVLALALKECGPIVYIKTNPTCLYHIAFHQYFLPLAVLADRNVPNEMILAMVRVWHKIMEALGSMNYTNDPLISDHASNMMVKWAIQFMKHKDIKDAVRPFITFFSSQNEAFVAFAFNRFLFWFVELRASCPKVNSDTGMTILLHLLSTLHRTEDNGKIALFIRLMASVIMDHALMAPESSASKAIANDIVMKMLECSRNNSNLVNLELKSCLAGFTRKHLPMETAQYFRFMYKLADKNPTFIKSIIPTIREDLSETERLRGVGEDKHLRRLLMQLEGAVEASLNRQNK